MKSITSRRAHKHSNTRHVLLLLVPIILFIGVLFVGLLRAAPYLDAKIRLHRIDAIYESLNLDSSYLPRSSDIFGDKRPYPPSMPGRTQASSATFIRADAVGPTTSDLQSRVTSAGFRFVREDYAGSASPEYHYESPQHEWILLTISSKPRDDDLQNKFLMHESLTAADYDMSFTAGPSDVTIKVNLNDDNE